MGAIRSHAAPIVRLVILACLLAFWVFQARAALPESDGEAQASEAAAKISGAMSVNPMGAQVYEQNCAACHDTGIARAPQRVILNQMAPAMIRKALISGAMQAQASALTDEEKTAVAEHLAGRKLGDLTAEASQPAMCSAEHAAFDLASPPAFAGWGLDPQNTHAVPTGLAGIDRANLGTLKLKWAFGFPGAARARSQPAIGWGAIYFGSESGRVYAVDADTGCVRWTYDAPAEVRTGIVLSQNVEDGTPLAFFADWSGRVHAVDALTGEPVWSLEADTHPATVLTGTPALHGDTLYVPVSSLEEASAAAPSYDCCTFRGSVLALDARTGAIKWRTWMVGEPVPQPADDGGKPLHGPSGVAVWTTPAVDAARGQIYVTTGDNYTEPATELSDAIVALDMETGAIRWSHQATEGDAWNVSCIVPGRTNCPDDAGPDYDFGAGPALALTSQGKQVVVAGQKSGIAYGLDPDSGELLWQTRLGRGGAAGGVHFGIAAGDGRLYVPISDLPDGSESEFPLSPGMYAVDLASGEKLWSTPMTAQCEGKSGCINGHSSAITATPELVFAGSDDGLVRVFDASAGTLVWSYDTSAEVATVNGVPAHGGAISGGAAPIAYQGKLYVMSGYGFGSKMPGNVLLVFETE